MLITPSFSSDLIKSEPETFEVTVGMFKLAFRISIDSTLEGGTFSLNFDKVEKATNNGLDVYNKMTEM